MLATRQATAKKGHGNQVLEGHLVNQDEEVRQKIRGKAELLLCFIFLITTDEDCSLDAAALRQGLLF